MNKILKDGELKIIKGRGIINVISTSKIKKITAIKKNRMEKYKRLEVLISNPHSKGDGFSRSRKPFFERRELRKIKITERPKAKEKSKDIINIKAMNFKIGSFMYFLYYKYIYIYIN